MLENKSSNQLFIRLKIRITVLFCLVFTPLFSQKDISTIPSKNDKAIDLIKNKIWFPSFELINIQGTRETHNISIEIQPDGHIDYDERFSGTFSTDMDYHKFPFDKQHFRIMVEAFTYDNRFLVLSNPDLYPKIKSSKHLFDKWRILNMSTRIENIRYEELETIYNKETKFSRAVFEIEAKRLSGYFVWQVLFPLFIIIMTSFVVFWIVDFSNQIGIGFTLMLTVVAFNFYSVTILPKLPYNTFIEFIIIVGYIFILLSIIAVITNNLINRERDKSERINLLKLFRLLFPICYLITMFVLSYLFFA